MAGSREELIEKFDPVARVQNRSRAFREAVEKESISAAEDVMNDRKFMRENSVDDIEARVKQEAEKRALKKGVFPPPRFGELPRENNAFDQLLSTAQLPATVPMRPVLNALDPQQEIQGTADLLGLKSVQDAITGQAPKLDDIGETLRNVLPAVAAGLPLARSKDVVFPLLRAIRAQSLATGGAITGAGLGVVLSEAEALRQEAELADRDMGRFEAIGKAATETPGLINQMAEEAIGDAILEQFTAGAAFGGRAAREKLAKVLGVDDPQVDAFLDIAKNHNVNLAVQDVTNLNIARKAAVSVGRLPFVNKKFVARMSDAADQFGKAYGSVLSAVAPTMEAITLRPGGTARSTDSRARRVFVTNRNLLEGANDAWIAARGEFGRRYGLFEQAASSSGAVVAPANTAITAAANLAAVRRGIRKKVEKTSPVLDQFGRPMKTTELVVQAPAGDLKRAERELAILASPEDRPGVADFRASMQRLQSAIEEVGGPDTPAGGVLVNTLNAMKKDFSDNLVGPAEVVALKKDADNFFRSSLEIFEGPAGSLIDDIDKEFGRIALAGPVRQNESLGRRQGRLNPLDTVKTLFDSGDPGVVNDVFRMLSKNLPNGRGERVFRESAGLWLEGKIRRRTAPRDVGGIPITDVNGLRKDLGFTNTDDEAIGAATRVMLRRSGVNPTEFDQLLALTERVFEFGVPDVSQLMTRRMLLGGLGSGARTFAPSTGALSVLFGKSDSGLVTVVDRIATSAGVFLMMGGGAKRMTNPQFLRSYRQLLDGNSPARVRLEAAQRLLALDTGFLVFDKLIPGDFQQEVDVRPLLPPPVDRSFPPVGPGTGISVPFPQQRE